MAEMTRKEEMLLKFMETSISRINTCLINIHALQVLLIKKGAFTEDELCYEVRDAKEMPLVHLGKHVLDEMVQNFNIDELSDIIKESPKINMKKS